MDPVTQAALGAACSQAALNNYDKRNAWLVGAIAGMAADLDVFIRSANDPMLLYLYHRHFSHSLSFIPIGGMLVALGLLMFKRFRQHGLLTLFAAIIGYATHGILDAFTSYGTLLYWPFSDRRIAWDIVAIIDPFFTFPLILGVIWTAVFQSRKGVLTGLLVACLFMVFNYFQHERAMTAIANYAEQNHWHYKKLRAFPDMASSTHWRAIAYINKNWFVADVITPLYKSAQVTPWGFYTAFDKANLPASIVDTGRQAHDFNVFNWFADGYLITASEQPLVVVDGRYLAGFKPPLTALWGIQFTPNKVHVERVGSIPLSVRAIIH